jgi:hypothetical protein
MVVRPRENSAATDPEVLGIVFVIGGALAVVTFVLYDIATQVGQDVESPTPLRVLRQAVSSAFAEEGAR